MNELDKFLKNIHRIADESRQSQLRFVTCKEVNWDERTMTAIGLSDDVPYYNVQLGFGYMNIKPENGSLCLIGILEGKDTLTFLINAENVELSEMSINKNYVVKIGDIEIAASNGIISIKNKSYSMRKAFDDILAAIGKLTVTTGVGPSGTPINIAEFQAVQKQLDNFLK